MEDLLSTAEAAVVVGALPGTVRRLCMEGRLPYVQERGRWIHIKRSDLDAAIAAGEFDMIGSRRPPKRTSKPKTGGDKRFGIRRRPMPTDDAAVLRLAEAGEVLGMTREGVRYLRTRGELSDLRLKTVRELAEQRRAA